MADKTSIEWTNATWNPTRGCTRVSPGCEHCYAERMALRFSALGQPYYGLVRRVNGHPAWTGKVVESGQGELPLHWERPRRVFVDSMSDLFHESLPDPVIARVFATMAAGRWHTFQVLTKRPERMARLLNNSNFAEFVRRGRIVAATGHRKAWSALQVHPDTPWPLPNVWIGTSVEDQKRADERIPHLLQTPAPVRFLSCEPLLGPIILPHDWLAGSLVPHDPGPSRDGDWWQRAEPRIHWVIGGGESGPGARPWHPAWARSLRDQCAAARVPFFWKQHGEWTPVRGIPSNAYAEPRAAVIILEDGRYVQLGPRSTLLPDWFDARSTHFDVYMYRYGKAHTGHLLDGQEWQQFPEVQV